jgi:hypothetical protein
MHVHSLEGRLWDLSFVVTRFTFLVCDLQFDLVAVGVQWTAKTRLPLG